MNTGVFRRILVPVEFEYPAEADIVRDGSVEVGGHSGIAVGPLTASALELAARLAGGGEVWLVHAATDFMNYATWMPLERINELNDAAQRHAIEVLEAQAAHQCTGVELHYVVKPGRPLDLVLDAARENLPDAIVLAASSRGRVQRALLGSTADKIIRQSPCPVIVVPAHGH